VKIGSWLDKLLSHLVCQATPRAFNFRLEVCHEQPINITITVITPSTISDQFRDFLAKFEKLITSLRTAIDVDGIKTKHCELKQESYSYIQACDLLHIGNNTGVLCKM
jgi:hypothetical protein